MRVYPFQNGAKATNMAIRPEEITSILERELQSYTREIKEEGVGTVLQVGRRYRRIYGLKECMVSELLEFLDAKAIPSPTRTTP